MTLALILTLNIEGEHKPLKMQTVATMETKDTTRLEKENVSEQKLCILFLVHELFQ
jgi:hypothetical protein